MEDNLKQATTSVPNSGVPATNEQILEYYQPAAECFPRAWEGLTDEVLLTLMEDIQKDRGRFRRMATELIFTFPALAVDLSPEERCSLLIDLTLALTTSVGAECIRRVESEETKEGRLARKWVTQKEDFTEADMKDLARSAQAKARYNPDGLGGKSEYLRASSEENASIIFEECANVLREETIPNAASRGGLQELMSGWFNRIARKADDRLRERIRKITTKQKKTVQVGDDDVLAPNTVAAFPVEGGAKLNNRNGWRLPAQFHKPERDPIFLNEIQAVETLTPKERQVIELVMEGRKEVQIAAELGVSQPRISQLKHNAIRKIQEAQKECCVPPDPL